TVFGVCGPTVCPIRRRSGGWSVANPWSDTDNRRRVFATAIGYTLGFAKRPLDRSGVADDHGCGHANVRLNPALQIARLVITNRPHIAGLGIELDDDVEVIERAVPPDVERVVRC